MKPHLKMKVSDMPSNANFPKSLPYRADIDGLRAVAILIVVIFHAFPAWMPAGFVGVDIFFVISGYLITHVILKDLGKGFSYLDFYARRFRRIVPALFVVIAFTFALGLLILLPDEIENLGRHVAAGSTFTSNFILWSESGYFATSAELKPLLHLWSLSVEEQFYLLWPPLLLLSLHLRRRGELVIVALFVASFAANLWMVTDHPARAFYLLPFRFWQILAGCGLAIFECQRVRDSRPSTPIANGLSIVGIFFLLNALLFINSNRTYPGYWGLLPVVTALSLLAAGEKGYFNQRVLARPLMVFIGRISYPFYLWHWPLLSLARLRFGPTSGITNTAILFISFALAWLTWTYVEKPAQFKIFTSFPTRTKQFLYISVSIALLAVFAIFGKAAERGFFLTSQQKNSLEALKNYRNGYATEYRSDICYFGEANGLAKNFSPECFKPDFNRQRLFIWGDSFAAHLYFGLAQVTATSDVQILQITACTPLLGLRESRKSHCREINEMAIEKIRIAKPTVILAANWFNDIDKPDFFASLDNTLGELKKIGVKVVVVGQVPLWTDGLPKMVEREFIMRGKDIPTKSTLGLSSRVHDVDERMVNYFTTQPHLNVELVRPLTHLCSVEGCLIRLGPNISTDLMSRDVGHLSPRGSEYLANSLLWPTLKKK
jgi:peptidoglycan/LPS O-acetylase OafA/YrhL